MPEPLREFSARSAKEGALRGHARGALYLLWRLVRANVLRAHVFDRVNYACVIPASQFPLWQDITMAVRKWSVSVDEDLAERVEEHVGNRGLSGFVAKAVAHELEHDILGAYLAELDREFGELPEGLVEEYDSRWPS